MSERIRKGIACYIGEQQAVLDAIDEHDGALHQSEFDKVFSDYTAKENKIDNIISIEHGKPMLFGADNEKGVVLNGFKLEVATLGENGITEADILVHDAHEEDSTLHMMLAKLKMPIVVGVIRAHKDDTFEIRLKKQVEEIERTSKYKSVDDLFTSGETWEIK